VSVSDIREAVSNLYAVFGDAPLGARVEGCLHCVSEAEQVALAGKPLRDLSASDLSRYAFKAMTTWGDISDFKHFLPRLLELLAFDSAAGMGFEAEILLSKLEYAGWLAWPDDEQEAVRNYATVLWEATLASYPSRIPMSDLVWGFARARIDLAPFLDRWSEAESASAVRHLADFVDDCYPALAKKGRLNEYQVPEEAQALVQRWLLSPRVRLRLEEAFFSCSGDEFAGSLSDAAQKLLWLQNRTVAS
jgi:hypothetical protein